MRFGLILTGCWSIVLFLQRYVFIAKVVFFPIFAPKTFNSYQNMKNANTNLLLSAVLAFIMLTACSNNENNNKTVTSNEVSFDEVFNNYEEEEPEFEVVRTKSVIVKPESVEEAILQMNLLGHQFYMFRNSADEKICVVYARKDGGYGQVSACILSLLKLN